MGVATLFLSAMYVGKVRFRAGLQRAVEAGKRLVRHEDQADMEKRIQTRLPAGEDILLDAHANERNKISSRLPFVSPRLILANVRSHRGKRFSENEKGTLEAFYHFHVTGTYPVSRGQGMVHETGTDAAKGCPHRQVHVFYKLLRQY
jgi:hypothetical protein